MHSLEIFYLFRKYFHNRKMSYIGIYIIKDTLGGRRELFFGNQRLIRKNDKNQLPNKIFDHRNDKKETL